MRGVDYLEGVAHSRNELADYLTVVKAFSDPNRVRMALALRGGELCVCQLIELLGLAPSTVSKHLSLLQQAGVVDSRKAGRWVYYRPADRAAPFVERMVSGALEALQRTPEIMADAARLEQIRGLDLEALCRRIQGRG